LLCLDTFWRSERRHLLFPHPRPPTCLKTEMCRIRRQTQKEDCFFRAPE
jgi:hypothetical protein